MDNGLLHSFIPTFLHSFVSGLTLNLLPCPLKPRPATSHCSQGLRDPALSDCCASQDTSLHLCALPQHRSPRPRTWPSLRANPFLPPPLHGGCLFPDGKFMNQHHLPHELAGQITREKTGEHFQFSKKKKKTLSKWNPRYFLQDPKKSYVKN